MPEQDHAKPKMKGYERILNSDPDRAQQIWDRGMHEDAWIHMMRYAAHKMGIGADPGPYTGPPVDFDKAAEELDKEDPEITPLIEDMMQEWEEEKKRDGNRREVDTNRR
jgi:hypothetical protein